MGTSLNGANKVNPRRYKGKVPLTVNILPTDDVVFKAGQPGYYDADGKAEVCGDDPTKVNFWFVETRAVKATATSSKGMLIDPETIYKIQVVEATTDAAATRAMVGALYSIEIINNVAVLDLDDASAHSNDIFKVDGLMSDVEPKRHAIADVPGCVFGHFITTASTDVDAG